MSADCKVLYKASENVIGLDKVVLRRPSMHEEQSSDLGYPKIPWLGFDVVKFARTTLQNCPVVLFLIVKTRI